MQFIGVVVFCFAFVSLSYPSHVSRPTTAAVSANLSRDLTVSCFLEADRRLVGFVFSRFIRTKETNFPIEIDFPLRL